METSVERHQMLKVLLETPLEVKEGEEIYVSREELLAENPQNPKICGGMEVVF